MEDPRQAWRDEYERSKVRDVPYETMSGVPVEPVYGDAPLPGQFPYTRGPYASMYRSKLWTMRMFAGFGTAADTNERFRALLGAGATGLSTAFDLPTLMGRDSDDPWAVGEVGKAGVAVCTLSDMEDLFGGIDLGNGDDVDDDQRAGRGDHGDVHRGRRPDRRGRERTSPARFRTTSSRSIRRRRSTCTRRARRCGSSPT